MMQNIPKIKKKKVKKIMINMIKIIKIIKVIYMGIYLYQIGLIKSINFTGQDIKKEKIIIILLASVKILIMKCIILHIGNTKTQMNIKIG